MTDEPWNPTDATYAIRQIARHPALSIAYKVHATQRLLERGIIISDVLYLLRNGFVYEHPRPASQNGYYKYIVESQTPNSSPRRIGAVVIPDVNNLTFKIVTVYWIDEANSQFSSVVEDSK